MGEKTNGWRPYQRQNHGSEQRGAAPTPSLRAVTYQREQSRQAKAEMLQKLLERRRAAEGLTTSEGIGNKELPAYRHKAEILEMVAQHRAVILGGETGSGKSTQVPQYLYEAGYEKVFVLVPRRVIADGLGDRIREELTGQLGDTAENLVGIIHGERTERHEDNRIVVMTPDTFNGMEHDIQAEYKDKKIAIIADEIHEANLFTEIATGVAAMAVQENEDWRLIAASATHNVDTLVRPFEKINGKGVVPMVTIEGRPHQVELLERPTQTPMEVYATMGDQHERSMIFTSGKKQIQYIIDQTRLELDKVALGASAKVIFRKLHGELTEVELAHIDDPVPEGYRLVIVSSPAGMSGITISGTTLVITDGTINRAELDKNNIPGLKRHYLSRAGIMQEIGRAGRDVPGGVGVIAMPIITDDEKPRKEGEDDGEAALVFKPFNHPDRLPHEPAEIYSSNLGRVVLRAAGLDRHFFDINEYIPHSVEMSKIIQAQESLSRLGALDDDDKITPVGMGMDRLSLSPELSRGVVEAQRRGRSIQHLAHTALIAAAVAEGGLQDFSHEGSSWRKLIRPETADDFIGQLDIAMAVAEAQKRYGWDNLNYFLYEHDLHPKKIERARKNARKVLRMLRIDMSNLELVPPTPDEEELLRRDFTAGMIDLVYQESSHHSRKTYYANIHGTESGTERYLSRYVAQPERGALIAGFPRWFDKKRGGRSFHHDVVEQALLVKAETVGDFARENGILTSRLLQPRFDGDIVVEQEQPMFGALDVGRPVKSTRREIIPAASQEALVAHALQRQGEAQIALRAVADELSLYRMTTPPEELSTYRKINAPEDITGATIEGLIRQFATETRSLSELDRKLAHHLYSKGVSISRYYEDQARIALQERSPEYIEIAGRETRIFYVEGTPYITHLTKDQRDHVSNGVFLPDGREVLLQVVRKDGKVRISMRDEAR